MTPSDGKPAPWPKKSSPRCRPMTGEPRPKSPARAFSTSSRTPRPWPRAWMQPWPMPRIGVRKAGPAQRVVVDLLGAEPGQGNARRPPALDHHRRRRGAGAGVPRRHRDPPEPRRRLGHPVRHADGLPAGKPDHQRTSCRTWRTSTAPPRSASTNPNEFADRARGLVVKLQAGDPECLALWSRFKRHLAVPLPEDLRAAERQADHGRRDGRKRLQRRPDQCGQRPQGQGPAGREQWRPVRVPR